MAVSVGLVCVCVCVAVCGACVGGWGFTCVYVVCEWYQHLVGGLHVPLDTDWYHIHVSHATPGTDAQYPLQHLVDGTATSSTRVHRSVDASTGFWVAIRVPSGVQCVDVCQEDCGNDDCTPDDTVRVEQSTDMILWTPVCDIAATAWHRGWNSVALAGDTAPTNDGSDAVHDLSQQGTARGVLSHLALCIHSVPCPVSRLLDYLNYLQHTNTLRLAICNCAVCTFNKVPGALLTIVACVTQEWTVSCGLPKKCWQTARTVFCVCLLQCHA